MSLSKRETGYKVGDTLNNPHTKDNLDMAISLQHVFGLWDKSIKRNPLKLVQKTHPGNEGRANIHINKDN